MLYSEIIAVCSHIHTKHINILCGQNVEFLSALVNLRKTNFSFVIYLRLSVHPYGTTTGRIFVAFYSGWRGRR